MKEKTYRPIPFYFITRQDLSRGLFVLEHTFINFRITAVYIDKTDATTIEIESHLFL